MKEMFKKALVDFLGSVGLYPALAADTRDMERLIRMLHPICPGVEMTRMGPAGDGGYLMPQDLEGIEACFSPGMAKVSGFEQACAGIGMKVFMADQAVAGPATRHPSFHVEFHWLDRLWSRPFYRLA